MSRRMVCGVDSRPRLATSVSIRRFRRFPPIGVEKESARIGVICGQIPSTCATYAAIRLKSSSPKSTSSRLGWSKRISVTAALDESGNVKHKHAPLLPYQVYSRVGKLPAFHFHLTGGGYCKADELRRVLAEINPDLEIRKLVGGWHPSPSML